LRSVSLQSDCPEALSASPCFEFAHGLRSEMHDRAAFVQMRWVRRAGRNARDVARRPIVAFLRRKKLPGRRRLEGSPFFDWTASPGRVLTATLRGRARKDVGLRHPFSGNIDRAVEKKYPWRRHSDFRRQRSRIQFSRFLWGRTRWWAGAPPARVLIGRAMAAGDHSGFLSHAWSAISAVRQQPGIFRPLNVCLTSDGRRVRPFAADIHGSTKPGRTAMALELASAPQWPDTGNSAGRRSVDVGRLFQNSKRGLEITMTLNFRRAARRIPDHFPFAIILRHMRHQEMNKN